LGLGAGGDAATGSTPGVGCIGAADVCTALLQPAKISRPPPKAPAARTFLIFDFLFMFRPSSFPVKARFAKRRTLFFDFGKEFIISQ
jgi:hypothetical protein